MDNIVLNNPIVEFGMNIVKASYDTKSTDASPMRWRAVDSDIDSDLYDEKMSIELFQDFTQRIVNNTPVPEVFKSAICEDSWCGGMPYLSIAHYKAGEGAKNVPGKVEAIYIDGTRLKSKGVLDDTPMGQQVFKSLREDLYTKKSDPTHLPVRISIGFLDLEHKHVAQQGGQEFVFTRSNVGQICPLCEQGIGGKIYLKGQLVHLALTRVPVNPRTEMVAVEKSMTDIIQTKKDDAKSIIDNLADELDERSLAEGTLVVRADSTPASSMPVDDHEWLKECYDPNTDSYNQDCLNRKLVANMVEMRKTMQTVKSQTVDVVENAQIGNSVPEKSGTSEAKMAQTETVVDGKVLKMVLGGESVAEKKFEYEGIDGDPGNNITAAPIPVKAKADKEDAADGADDEAAEGEDKKMKSLKSATEKLMSLVSKGASVDEVNAAFAEIGNETEKAYQPKSQAVDLSNMTEVIRSAVEQAVSPLRIEIAQLKAVGTVSKAQVGQVPYPRSLQLKPADLMQKSQAQNAQPQRKLTQIEMIARRSTGASVPEQ